MKDVVNENIKIENEGVSVEISDNSTQINIDRRLSKKDVNRLLGFIEILMAESEKNAHAKTNGMTINQRLEKGIDKEDIRKLYRYITTLDKNSPNYRNRNIHDKEGKPNATAS